MQIYPAISIIFNETLERIGQFSQDYLKLLRELSQTLEGLQDTPTGEQLNNQIDRILDQNVGALASQTNSLSNLIVEQSSKIHKLAHLLPENQK